jgi:hypothetical protein
LCGGYSSVATLGKSDRLRETRHPQSPPLGGGCGRFGACTG